MARWIGVCLPMQGKWFASCLGRIPHAVDKLSPWAATTEAHSSRACTAQQKQPLQWAACPPWLGSSSYSLQLESLQAATKACVCACSGSVLSDSLQPPGHSPPGSMGFSRQEYWSRLSFPPPGDLPNPGFEPGAPLSQADSLLSEPPSTTKNKINT